MTKLKTQQKSDNLFIYHPGIHEVMEKNLKPTMDFELTFEDGETTVVSTFAIPKPYVRDEQLAANMMAGINEMLHNGHHVVSARLILRRKRRMRNMVARLRGGAICSLQDSYAASFARAA